MIDEAEVEAWVDDHHERGEASKYLFNFNRCLVVSEKSLKGPNQGPHGVVRYATPHRRHAESAPCIQDPLDRPTQPLSVAACCIQRMQHANCVRFSPN